MFTREQAAYYLAAMIDGEGTVAKADGRTNKMARVTNTDRRLIAACEECCEALDIAYTVVPRKAYKAHWASGWDLVVSGKENIGRLSALPLRSLAKKQRLLALLASYRPARPAPELLRELYVDRGMSIKAIGRYIGRPWTSVRQWLVADGVEIRSLSEAGRLRWGGNCTEAE